MPHCCKRDPFRFRPRREIFHSPENSACCRFHDLLIHSSTPSFWYPVQQQQPHAHTHTQTLVTHTQSQKKVHWFLLKGEQQFLCTNPVIILSIVWKHQWYLVKMNFPCYSFRPPVRRQTKHWHICFCSSSPGCSVAIPDANKSHIFTFSLAYRTALSFPCFIFPRKT